MKKFISLLMASFMALTMLVGCGGGGSSTEEVKPASEEYVALLKEYGLEDVNYTFPGKKSIVFGMHVSDDTLEIMAFGYTKDIVEEMYDKVYMSIEGYDDATIEQIDSLLKDEFKKIEDLKVGTVEYTIDKDINKYIIEIHYPNMDKETVKTLVSEGLISGSPGMEQISVKQTLDGAEENNLIVR